jgi:hypothetical protein
MDFSGRKKSGSGRILLTFFLPLPLLSCRLRHLHSLLLYGISPFCQQRSPASNEAGPFDVGVLFRGNTVDPVFAARRKNLNAFRSVYRCKLYDDLHRKFPTLS